MRVKDIMTTPPIAAEIPGAREDAAKLLVEHKVSGIPVVKAGTRDLAGVITRTDLLRRPDEEQLALVMTRDPYTVAPETDVAEAARLLAEHAIHGLPVVEDEDQLVGVVSPTDVLRAIGGLDGKRIRDLDIGHVAPVHSGTPMRVVWEIMKLGHHNALPVLDDDANLVGIVADSDLFEHAVIKEGAIAQAGGNAEEEESWKWEQASLLVMHHPRSRIDLPVDAVSSVMKRNVHTVFDGSGLGDAARKLVKHGINQLPVVDSNDRLAGMVRDFDVIRAAFS